MLKPLNYTLMFTLLVVAASFATPAMAEEKKVTVTQTQFGKPITPLASTSATAQKKIQPGKKARNSISHTSDVDFWIFDSWVTLYEDSDYDGFYSRFSVEFDVDTIFAEAPVYAVIYLGDEEVFESIHVSSVFSVYGEDSHDSIIIDSELVSGFSPYDYDILVEIYDAQTEELVATTDGYSDADLAFVSLESSTYEYYQEETVVVVEQSGGGVFTLSLLLMAGMVVVRRLKA